jgi:hypothetical protein
VATQIPGTTARRTDVPEVGYFKIRENIQHLLRNPDIAALRSRDNFKKFMTTLDTKPATQ